MSMNSASLTPSSTSISRMTLTLLSKCLSQESCEAVRVYLRPLCSAISKKWAPSPSALRINVERILSSRLNSFTGSPCRKTQEFIPLTASDMSLSLIATDISIKWTGSSASASPYLFACLAAKWTALPMGLVSRLPDSIQA